MLTVIQAALGLALALTLGLALALTLGLALGSTHSLRAPTMLLKAELRL